MRVIRVFHYRESRVLNFHVKKGNPGLDSEEGAPCVRRVRCSCGAHTASREVPRTVSGPCVATCGAACRMTCDLHPPGLGLEMCLTS